MTEAQGAPRSSMDVSVIICAYTMDRWDDLCRAIDSVEAQTTPAKEIILVIDHNDDLLNRSRVHFGRVLVVPNSEKQGLSGARNTGWKLASGEVVAFLDDDAAAERDWLQHLINPYEDPEVVGVGGFIQPAWIDARPASFPDEFLWVVGCSYRGLPIMREPVRNVIGANMSLRRSALVYAGGFDAELGRIGERPVGCEETELCIRIARCLPGSVFMYEPAARVRHNVPRVRTTWSYFRARCYAEGLSKAHVRRLSTPGEALRTERSYVRRTLPIGAASAVGRSLKTRTPATSFQAVGIVVGLTCTTAGFVIGSIRPAAPSAAPTLPETGLANRTDRFSVTTGTTNDQRDNRDYQ
jgi:glycosyltransferase involved in cell wall biosynthesis